ncbi:hypothetical protein CHR52_02235 [Mycobacterium tuberculosis]|nr:hypothetical protein CHR52_02235 [Mycobacterium tuberculosis]AVO11034.1 hypothetical protein CHR51_02930 [Mycobacterium tuberculosis]
MGTAVEVGWRDPCGLAVGELRCAPAVSDQPVVGCAGCPLVDMVDFAPVTGCVAVGSTMGAVNRPGMSGDSSSWKGWGHVRWFIEEVPAGAA